MGMMELRRTKEAVEIIIENADCLQFPEVGQQLFHLALADRIMKMEMLGK